jgi:hypothetical protein
VSGWAWSRFKDHAAQAVPFGLGMLFLFRGRAEQ